MITNQVGIQLDTLHNNNNKKYYSRDVITKNIQGFVAAMIVWIKELTP